MILLKYEHNDAYKVIPSVTSQNVENMLSEIALPRNENTKIIRKIILDELSQHGWSDTIRISTDSKITITSYLNDIGLCLQTGNMSRFYADLLKLQALFCNKKIIGGIYILPSKHEAKNMGQNIAHFDRFVAELVVFTNIITIPMLVYGFERR